MKKPKNILTHVVPEEWIDYNGHMNDAEYMRAFSWGIDAFMKDIGLNEKYIEQNKYTMYTLETHICYLDEMEFNETFEIYMRILDYDEKRVHAFLELYGAQGKRAATSEQMLMGIDQTTGRSAAFPEVIYKEISKFQETCTPEKEPKEVGRIIGIKRK